MRKYLTKYTLGLCCVIFMISLTFLNGRNIRSPQSKNVNELIQQIKKSVVFLGEFGAQGNRSFYATGFLVSVESVYYLLTAKHVVINERTGRIQDDGMHVFFNQLDGTIGSRSIEEIKQNYKLNWIFHENPEVDIALIPFGLNYETDDVKVLPDQMFLSAKDIVELYDVFFISYQPGIEPVSKILPVFRGGIVSTINEDRSFYIDAFAFPGNSGSPVFLKPSAVRTDGKNILIGEDPYGYKFIGIIGEYIPYQEMAISTKTNRPRIIFEENTGLSKVWSVEHIGEIFESRTFKEQLRKIPRH